MTPSKAAATLHALGRNAEITRRFGHLGPAEAIADLLDSAAPLPRTSSLGRWFDAAAALLGVIPFAAYEGHAAMALEALVRRPLTLDSGWAVAADGTLDLLPLLDRLSNMSAREGAELWHGTLSAALADWAAGAAARAGGQSIALAGGCLLNRVLRELLAADLSARGFEVLLPVSAPPSDGGISLGQAWVAAQAMGVE